MKNLLPLKPLSEHLLAPGVPGVRIENTDEEHGAGDPSENRRLRPDMPHFTCRSVAMTSANASADRLVVVPEDSVQTVRSTVRYLKQTALFRHLIEEESVVGVECAAAGTLIENLLSHDEHPLHEVLSREPHGLSLTMHSSQSDALRKKHPHTHAAGNLRLSEMFNNKAISDGICRQLHIPVPDAFTAFSYSEAVESYDLLKQRLRRSGKIIFPIFMKGGRSASAFGLAVLRSDEDFFDALPKFEVYFEPGRSPVKGITPHDALGVVFQEGIPHSLSIGATVLVGRNERDHTFVGMTRQEFSSGYAHGGNVYSDQTHLSKSADRNIRNSMVLAANHAAQNGGVGTVLSADFVVPSDRRSDVPHLVEFNMRKSAPFGGYEAMHALHGTTQPTGVAYRIHNIPLSRHLQPDDPVGHFSDCAAHAGVRLSVDEKSGVIKPGFLPLSFAVRDMIHGVTYGHSQQEIDEIRERLQETFS